MDFVLAGCGGVTLDECVEAIARLGELATLEEAFAAFEAELAETSPRSSISRPRSQEYKHQGPLPETRYERPWSSWDSSGLVSPLGQARGPPPKRGLTAQVKPERSSRGPAKTHAIRR